MRDRYRRRYSNLVLDHFQFVISAEMKEFQRKENFHCVSRIGASSALKLVFCGREERGAGKNAERIYFLIPYPDLAPLMRLFPSAKSLGTRA